MPPRRRIALLAVLVSVAWPGGAAAGADVWSPPVPGAVVAPFAYTRAAPFAAGARRGVDLATHPGRAVRAACAGRVVFTGRTPRGGAVTVRCGRLLATHLPLRAPAVTRGQRVARGGVLGVAAGRTLRLGARRAGDPFGYVDPLALLAEAPPAAPPPAPVPAAPRPPVPRPPVAPPPAVAPPRAVAPSRAATSPAPAPATATPPLVWLALALVALGLPTGALARRARRPRPAARAARALDS